MITTTDDLRGYLRADGERYEGSYAMSLLRLPQLRWLVRLRLTEWWCNTRRSLPGRVFGAVLRQRLQASATALGYTIPINVLGPGIKLPHVGTIVIHGDARVGRHCRILQGVTLGAGRGGSPELAADVSVGPNATVLGAVQIGAGAWIGAGSVVTSDVPPGQVWAGVPARCLRESHD